MSQARHQRQIFRYESDLVNAFVAILTRSCPWGSGRIATEFDYRSGRTDIIFFSDTVGVVTFEAKLAKWRQAMTQAYRNAIFSQQSYILLPPDIVRIALRNRRELERRQIGLVTVRDGSIDVVMRAPTLSPLLAGLHRIASEFVKESDDGEWVRSGSSSPGALCSA